MGILLLFLSLVILLSLVSYSPQDPSWNTITVSERVHNLIGPIGSHLADLLLQTLGFVAFAPPLILCALAWYKLRSRPVKAPLVKMAGWIALFMACTGLISLALPSDYYVWRNIHPGGFLGVIILSQLESVLNPTGAALVLGATLVLALMAVANISFVGGIEAIAKQLSRLRLRAAAREKQPGVLSGEKPLPVPLQKEPSKAPEPKIAGWEERGPVVKAPGVPAQAAPQAGGPPVGARREKGKPSELLPSSVAGIETVAPRPASSLDSATGQGKDVVAPLVGSEADIEVEPREKPRVPLPVDIEEVIEGTTAPATIGSPIAARRGDIARPARTTADQVAEMLSTASVRSVKPVEKASHLERKSLTRAAEKFVLPSIDMLTEPPPPLEQAREELMQRAVTLAEKCKEFAVTGHVHQISPGPVVTTFEFKPDPGIKYSRITSLVDDLCLALEAESIRIDRLPGKSTVGIEVPNKTRELIYLREIIEARKFQESRSRLTIALGKTIDGGVYITDLAKMPHLLIAGATGSGKSMTVNCIITSILYKATPDEVKFILIDPKRLELGLYEGIPYLLAPIVNDPKRAAYALKWAVAEMENRYKLLASFGVRNIEQFNREIRDFADRHLTLESGEPVRPLPYIVIVIDELADLMVIASSEVETAVTRLAQMARAVGLHLVLTTQRPSVDVITGLIKANFPCRIAFRVSSKVDSRTIIDSNGAEALLGRGDMLFLPPGSSRLVRVHGAFIDEKEIKQIVEFLKAQASPEYDDTVLMSDKEYEAAQSSAGGEKYDELYEDALKIVIQMGRASTSVLQRRLRIGYGRAASIIDMMEREGYVEPADGPRPRAITRKALEFRDRLQQMEEEED